jgi:hypothetical protein
MCLKNTIFDEIRNLAVEQKAALPPLADNLNLHDLGIDSFFLAVLFTRLAHITGRDLLDSIEVEGFPQTVSELAALYS